MDTNSFNEQLLAKSRAVCERIEREDAGSRIGLTERERQILDMWPKFEDDGYVWFGDEVSRMDVRSFVFVESGAMVTNLTSVPAYGECRKYGEPFKRPAPADSWERLEADAELESCDYFEQFCDDCDGCPAECIDVSCHKVKARDIIRRAKALAGAGE